MPDSQVGQHITAITQVLTVAGNLIDNAIDAAALAPAPREVELTLVAAESDLLIRVRDTGPGVPQDLREEIFTDGVTTKSSVTGARRGLGLALVRQIVEGMGGMVSVGQDGGAVFTAVLPGCLDARRRYGARRRRRCRGPGSCHDPHPRRRRRLPRRRDPRRLREQDRRLRGHRRGAQRRRGGRRGGPAPPRPDAARPLPARTSTGSSWSPGSATATRRWTSS